MSKGLKIGIGIIVLIALVLISSLFLPGDIHVERSLSISKPATLIFNQVNNLKKWENWSPWAKMDTAMAVVYGDTFIGMGGNYSWNGEIAKTGQLTITESISPLSIKTQVRFGGEGEGQGSWKFEETEGSTLVTWGMDTQLSGPMKFMGLFFDRMMGPDFEKGLANLKDICEKMELPQITVEEVDLPPQISLLLRRTVPIQEIGKNLGEMYAQIMAVAATGGAQMAGPPFAIYYSYSANGTTDFAASIPIDKAIEGSNEVKFAKRQEGKMLSTIFIGPYENLQQVYQDLETYMDIMGYQRNGPPMEIYLDDPTTVAPEEVRTQILWPII